MFKQKVNVLVTSAGVETAINVMKALKKSSRYECKFIATDMSELSPGLYLADKYYITPSAKSEDFLGIILSIAKKEQVDFIFPIHSTEIEIFAQNTNIFNKERIGIILPSLEVVKKCIYKDIFIDFLQANNFPHPKTYRSAEEIENFPIFFKKNYGSSSRGAQKVESKEELEFLLKKGRDGVILQEYLDLPELTVDFYVNKNYYLVGYVPRYRLKVKDGKSVVAKTMRSSVIEEVTEKLLRVLQYKGAGNMQMFYNEISGEVKIIEINPRLSAGGLPLTVEAGINIPELMLIDYFDGLQDIRMEYNDNLTMYRYYTEIFR